MKKKFVCTVCGYIHEGEEAPAQCPQCKAPASKFKELVDTELTFVTEHVIYPRHRHRFRIDSHHVSSKVQRIHHRNRHRRGSSKPSHR